MLHNPEERPSASLALKHKWFDIQREKMLLEIRNDPSNKESFENFIKFKINQDPNNEICLATRKIIALKLMPAKQKNMILKMFRIMDKSCDQKLGPQEINLGYRNICGNYNDQ